MKPLFTAIYTFANAASDFKTAIGGRFYLSEAPQSATYPFAVYSLVSLMPDYIFSAEMVEPTIQISIFSNDTGADEVVTAWGYMTTLFDDAAISVTGYGTVEFRRDLANLIREPETNVWHYATDYELILSKN
jgi:hypothetical protein